jgi:NADPH2:quinone reductase
MRAIICEEFGSPENLEIKEVDAPVPGPSDVLIHTQAVGLGFVDALTVAGLYQIKPRLPFVPGNELTGIVEEVGSDVKHLRIGERILATPSSGALAEKICLPESSCIPVPDVLSSEAAASFQVNYCTAFHGLNDCATLAAGETILILGASGGVGVAAIDVAKAMGAFVIAAASTPEKREACLLMGADKVVDYTQENWRDQVKQALGGKALDVVYDPVGGEFTEPALRSLGPNGRFLVVGFATGNIPKIPLNLMLLKRSSVVGVNWGGFIAANPNEARPVLTTLLEWIASGKLHPEAGESFTLAQAGSAMMKMLERKAIGKIVISI